MSRGTIFMLFAVIAGTLAVYFAFYSWVIAFPYILCSLVWGVLAVVEWSTHDREG